MTQREGQVQDGKVFLDAERLKALRKRRAGRHTEAPPSRQSQEMSVSKTACLARAFLLALAAAGALAPAVAQAADGLDRISWLGGCWVREGAEPGTGEHWTQPAAGTMLGMGRTVRAGQTVEFEFMRIHVAPDGKLLFTALPSGQREATFTEFRSGETEIAFENPEHDFPQRVIYRLQSKMRLLASIEGTRKGAARRIEFPMQRVKCDQ